LENQSSFDVGDFDAGKGHLVGQWKWETEGILKNDWGVGFGKNFTDIENKVINS
jgi:hypothetical protein